MTASTLPTSSPAVPPQPVGQRNPPITGGALTRSRSVALLLAGIVLVGVALRGYRLADRSLWFDEAFCWRMSEFPLGEMVGRVGGDNHPPLYFLLLKGWVGLFGTSVVALRSLSVLLGGLTILGMYLFAAEAFATPQTPTDPAARVLTRGRGIGLLVASLVALSAFQVRWGWEARMYTLGTALAAFSSWALFRALRPSAAVGWWCVYGVLALLFAYTHYYALFSIAAQGLFVLGYLLVRARGNPLSVVRDGTFWRALLAAEIIIVGSLPWLPIFLRQRAQVQAAFWSRPLTRWDVPNVCWQMFLDPEYLACSHDEALVVALACGLVLASLLWRPRAGEWYVLLTAGVPFGLSVLVSYLDTRAFNLRYFLFAHLFLLAALAVLLWRLPWPLERGAICLVLLGAVLCTHLDFRSRMAFASKPGVRGAAEFIASRRSAGEPVVVCSPLFYFSVLYHLGDGADCRVYNNGRPVVHYEGGAIILPGDLITDDQLRALRAARVWVVNMRDGGWGTRSVPVPPGWVRQGAEQLFPEAYRVQGNVVVVEYHTAGLERPRPREGK